MQDNDWQEMQRKQREYQERQAGGKESSPLKPYYGPTTGYSTYIERPGCVTFYVLLLVLGVFLSASSALKIWLDYRANEYVCTSGSIFTSDCGPYREIVSEIIGVPLSIFLVYAAFLIGLMLVAIPTLWRMRLIGWWAIMILHSLNILAVLVVKTRVAIPQLIGSVIVLYWFSRNQKRFE